VRQNGRAAVTVTHLAIVTGTTRGLGRALKQQFEGAGWHTAELNRPAFDLSALDVERLANMLQSFNSGDLERVVFVNNAATQLIGAADTLKAEDIAREITVNITSPLIAISTFLRHFPRGEVANISSSAATKAIPHWSLYSAAKAALESYLRVIESEGARVFNLNPGVVDTDMQAGIRKSSFPGKLDFVKLKDDGKLKSPDAVARSLVWMIDRAGLD
jgi:benzil reductase ((S)-benzoin forming)